MTENALKQTDTLNMLKEMAKETNQKTVSF